MTDQNRIVQVKGTLRRFSVVASPRARPVYAASRRLAVFLTPRLVEVEAVPRVVYNT